MEIDQRLRREAAGLRFGSSLCVAVDVVPEDRAALDVLATERLDVPVAYRWGHDRSKLASDNLVRRAQLRVGGGGIRRQLTHVPVDQAG
ncbi:MAG: hypothetical protein ACRDRS_12020 [Pseudonocardiaceae bacterium]